MIYLDWETIDKGEEGKNIFGSINLILLEITAFDDLSSFRCRFLKRFRCSYSSLDAGWNDSINFYGWTWKEYWNAGSDFLVSSLEIARRSSFQFLEELCIAHTACFSQCSKTVSKFLSKCYDRVKSHYYVMYFENVLLSILKARFEIVGKRCQVILPFFSLSFLALKRKLGKRVDSRGESLGNDMLMV